MKSMPPDTTGIEVIAELLSLITDPRISNGGRLFFRGEEEDFGPDACVPGVYRNQNLFLKRERFFYNEARSRFPNEFTDDSPVSILVKMQHYGIPTRLLDITENILIALYFALGPWVQHDELPNLKDGYVYVIKVPFSGRHYDENDRVKVLASIAKEAFSSKASDVNESTDQVVFFQPKWENPRIIAQQGAMLLFGGGKSKRSKVKLPRGKGNTSGTPYVIAKVTIPAKLKTSIRSALHRLGIADWTVFPDLEHLGENLRNLAAFNAGMERKNENATYSARDRSPEGSHNPSLQEILERQTDELSDPTRQTEENQEGKPTGHPGGKLDLASLTPHLQTVFYLGKASPGHASHKL